jgi:hypothetical protein
MTQEERWQIRYDEVVEFIESNHRNPSKHRIEEHDMLNWLKANRKVLNAGKMKAERVEPFMKLLELSEQYRRKNQYE